MVVIFKPRVVRESAADLKATVWTTVTEAPIVHASRWAPTTSDQCHAYICIVAAIIALNYTPPLPPLPPPEDVDTNMCPGGTTIESRTHIIGECEIYTMRNGMR